MVTSIKKIRDNSVSKEALLSENAKLRKGNADLKAANADLKLLIEVITEHSDLLMEEFREFNIEKRSLLRKITALNWEIAVLEKELDELKCKEFLSEGNEFPIA